jgi:hypothetical protein
MSIVKVVFEENCTDPYALDLFNCAHVYRSLGVTFEFGTVSSTLLPVVTQAPHDIPSASAYVCFFNSAWSKDVSQPRKVFSGIQDRLLSVKDIPAHHDEFDIHQLLSAETVGHETRCLACFETDRVRRAGLFDKAYRIYEGVILACCHSSMNSMLQTISKGSAKALLFQPFAEMEKFTPDGRRVVSHSFAGMAVCALMGEGTISKFVSLTSAAVCWEARRPLELACTLRMLPLLMSQADFTVKPAEVLDMDAFMGTVSKIRSTIGMFTAVTDNVLLPLMLRLGRRDLFDQELVFMQSERRADCERFALSVELHRTTTPVSLKTVRTHVVQGKLVERVCASCNVWEGNVRTKFMRCSGCGCVYYCGKPCQLAHWKAHKLVCGK